ncbi:HPC2 and ubinuclein domain [Tyrophagus putrescentiae]|nr:HPC2 and ubinuclein domain [Tyrophagus putrescentiae]
METVAPKPPAVHSDKPKKVKSSKKNKPVALRFEVELDLSEDACNIISFPDLVRRASKKKESKRSDDATGSGTNPHDPFGDEDEDEVARIAAQFEEKYGRGNTYEDFIDKGEGYDENDSFIDNAEAYDELIPTSLTTEHDGFYINTGELKFKPVEEANGSAKVVEETEFEKAQILQKLKRKRNRIEDDDDSNGDGPLPTTTKVPRKKKEKVAFIEQSSSATAAASLQYDRPPKSSASASAVSALEQAQNDAQQPFLPKKYKRQSQQQQQFSMAEQSAMLSAMEKHQRKMAKGDASSFTPTSSPNAAITSTLYGSKGPPASAADPVTMATFAHNVISSTIQQMISNSGNAAGTSSVNGVGTSSSNNPSLLQLKNDLFSCKVPIEIVQTVPLSKPLSSDCLGFEWDCFLVELIKCMSTSSLSQKNRHKIFDTISRYLGWKQEQFYGYITKNAINQVNAGNISSSSYSSAASGTSKASNRKSPSPSAPASAASPNHSYMSLLSGGGGGGGNSSSLYNSVPGASLQAAAIAQSFMKQKKSSTQQQSAAAGGNSAGAMNLCTTNNQTSASTTTTSYGEGLAGKLMAPTSSDPSSLLQGPIRKSSSSSSSSSKNKATAESLINSAGGSSFTGGHGPNFAMLQTLASLANSNSGNPMHSLTTTNSRIGGGSSGAPMMAHTGHQLSRSGAERNSPSLNRSTGSSPSPTIISSSSASTLSSATNPNSLLLSAVAHSAAAAAAAASKATNSMAGQLNSSSNISSSSSGGGGLNANNQIFNSLFTSLPNLFSNTEILNRFLSADAVNASARGGGGVSGSALGAQHQRMVNEFAKSLASGGGAGGGGGGGKSPSVSSSSNHNSSPLNNSLLMNAAQISAQHHQQQQQHQLHRSNSISSSNSVSATGLPTFITPSPAAVARSLANTSGPVSSALMSSILSGVGQQQQQQMPGANQKPK